MECAQIKDISNSIFKDGRGYFIAYGTKYKGRHNTKQEAEKIVKKDCEKRY